MNTILVLTDFSEKSARAAEYGLRLAAALDTDLLLFNSYTLPHAEMSGTGMMPPFFVDYELFEGLSTGELRKEAARLQDRMDQEGLKAPRIRWSNGYGGLGAGVVRMLEEEEVSMIVMGSRGNEALIHFFYGSDAAEVVRRATCPVLMVPPDAVQAPVRRIAFAADQPDERVRKALGFVAGMAASLGAEIVVTHVSPPDAGETSPEGRLAGFREAASALGYDRITCTDVPGDDIPGTLLRFTESGGFDLLALVHKRHTLYEKVFDESVTRKVMGRHQVPYMIFPENF